MMDGCDWCVTKCITSDFQHLPADTSVSVAYLGSTFLGHLLAFFWDTFYGTLVYSFSTLFWDSFSPNIYVSLDFGHLTKLHWKLSVNVAICAHRHWILYLDAVEDTLTPAPQSILHLTGMPTLPKPYLAIPAGVKFSHQDIIKALIVGDIWSSGSGSSDIPVYCLCCSVFLNSGIVAAQNSRFANWNTSSFFGRNECTHETF